MVSIWKKKNRRIWTTEQKNAKKVLGWRLLFSGCFILKKVKVIITHDFLTFSCY